MVYGFLESVLGKGGGVRQVAPFGGGPRETRRPREKDGHVKENGDLFVVVADLERLEAGGLIAPLRRRQRTALNVRARQHFDTERDD